MDHLKEGIGLRGYGQKDPIREYQREGYETFAGMIVRIKADTVEKLSLVPRGERFRIHECIQSLRGLRHEPRRCTE